MTAVLEPWIYVTHRGLGLPVQDHLDGPFNAEWDPYDAESVCTAVVATLRFERQIARDYAPQYSPKFYIDEEPWKVIWRRFNWLPAGRVAVVPPATDADVLKASGFETWEALSDYAGATPTFIKATVRDAYGRPALPVVRRAMDRVHLSGSWKERWRRSLSDASKEWLSENWPDLVRVLANTPPVARDYQNVFQLRSNVTRSWIAAGRPLAFKSVKAILRKSELLGVFKPARRSEYYWGPVWRYALTYGTELL